MLVSFWPRRTGLRPRGFLGGAGVGHRGSVGDRQIISQHSSIFGLSHGEIKGWTWDFQSGRRAPTLKARGGEAAPVATGEALAPRKATRTKQSFRGWPSRVHANLWSEQSGRRNALSPAQRVSPRQRAGSRSCIRPPSWSQSHPANAGKRERQAVYQTQQYRGLVVGRAVVPPRGMTGGMGEVRP